ncbi:TPA: hypothetical protein ACJI3N_005358 [Raoultella planticola]
MKIAWQTQASVYRKGNVDMYGAAEYQFLRRVDVGVVAFIESMEKSTVRADSSASRGKAEQAEFDAVLIVPLESKILMEDLLVMEGKKLRVESIHRRWGLHGRPGHLELGANVWA